MTRCYILTCSALRSARNSALLFVDAASLVGLLSALSDIDFTLAQLAGNWPLPVSLPVEWSDCSSILVQTNTFVQTVYHMRQPRCVQWQSMCCDVHRHSQMCDMSMSCHLDYCNLLLTDVIDGLLRWLIESVENAAAHLVTHTRWSST